MSMLWAPPQGMTELLFGSKTEDWTTLRFGTFSASKSILKQEEAQKGLNPFQTVDHMNAREWAKLIVGIFFLAPIRFVCMLLILVVATLLMSVTVVGVDIEKPLSPKRMQAQTFITSWTAYLLCLCFGIFRVHVVGKPADVSECKLVVVAPHSTVMDPFVIASALQGASSVGKKEALRTIIGPFLRASQSIFVDREDKGNRSKAARAIKERVQVESDWNRQLVLFPEGTCTNRTSLISFRKGAFEPGEPLQPILVRWQYSSMDPTWTAGAPSRTLIAIRTLSQFTNSVTVEFLPVHIPSDEEKKNPIKFANNVRANMARRLGVPTTEHSYADSFLAKLAAKQHARPCKVLPFSLHELAAETQHLGIPSSSALYDETRTLLVCFLKAPGITKEALLQLASFEAIAHTCADQLGLSHEVAWNDLVAHQKALGSQPVDGVTFHAFVLAHLNAKYRM